MRKNRQFSYTGFYHVIMRGTGKQVIFEDDEDRTRFMRILEKLIEESAVNIHAYCLMDNHFHLLIHDPEMEIVGFMRKLGTGYAKYFNTRHEHVGHVFQDRYKSEPIDNMQYYLVVLRYIIQNPLKAGFGINDVYRKTSYEGYFNRAFQWCTILTTSLAIELFDGNMKAFRNYLLETNTDKCLEDISSPKISDEELRTIICNIANVESPLQVKGLAKTSRDYVIAQIVEVEPSNSRIERETGVGRTIIRRIRKQTMENPTKSVPVG